MSNGLTSGTLDVKHLSPLNFTDQNRNDVFFSWEASLTKADDPFFRVEPVVLFGSLPAASSVVECDGSVGLSESRCDI